MKKLLIVLTGLMLSISAFSQSYRGMLDLSIGLPTSGEKTISFSDGTARVRPEAGLIFSMSHGCQITKSFFAGLGVGIGNVWCDEDHLGNESSSPDSGEHSYATVPIFVDLRWDLDIRKKITPFVDLKVGYQMEVVDEFGPKNGSMYFQPTAGVRFRGGKRTGFNLGISYVPSIKKRIEPDYWTPRVEDEKECVISKNGLIMLNLGFDF